MTTNGTTRRPRTAATNNEILADAARRMFPVLAGRVLNAVADRAVEKVDQLADRLHERSTGAGTDREHAPAPEGTESPGRAGAAVAFLMEQARLFLAFVVRLASQALEMLRRATERLRARRAPEGIDEAPAPEDTTDPGDLDDPDAEDDLLDDEDEDIEERVTARV